MITHKGFYKNNDGRYSGLRYLCNQAVTISLRKWSYHWKYVTCKNCLKQKKGAKE